MSDSPDRNPQHPKIRFSESTGFGAVPSGGSSPASSGFEIERDESGPLDVSATSAPLVEGSKKIRSFERQSGTGAEWMRTPHAKGTGAIHVRTFHSKLNSESLVFMDQTINEWLDAHPEYEVKLVTSTIGEFTGKIREQALICQVWV